jgi:hypothetical protein
VTDFLATSDGLSLVKAFMCIKDAKLRRAIVRLVEEIVPETAWSKFAPKQAAQTGGCY